MTSTTRRPPTAPLTPVDASALSAVLVGAAAPTPRPADPCPDAARILAQVPVEKQGVVRAYLNSHQAGDEARGRELAARYGIDYEWVQAAWGAR